MVSPHVDKIAQRQSHRADNNVDKTAALAVHQPSKDQYSDKENVAPHSHVHPQDDDEQNMAELVAKIQRQEKALYKKQRSALTEKTSDIDEDYADAYTDPDTPPQMPCDDNFRAIWASGFSLSTNDDELKAMFERCGNVLRATVIRDKYTWRSKGCVRWHSVCEAPVLCFMFHLDQSTTTPFGVST